MIEEDEEGVISTDDDDDEEDYPDSPSAGDDDVEDATFGAPQWSWCGYKIDDDKFKSELGKLIASARAQGELTMEGGQCLLRRSLQKRPDLQDSKAYHSFSAYLQDTEAALYALHHQALQ